MSGNGVVTYHAPTSLRRASTLESDVFSFKYLKLPVQHSTFLSFYTLTGFDGQARGLPI